MRRTDQDCDAEVPIQSLDAAVTPKVNRGSAIIKCSQGGKEDVRPARQLTFVWKSNRRSGFWRKMLAGELLYLGPGASPDDEASYLLALAEYQRILSAKAVAITPAQAGDLSAAVTEYLTHRLAEVNAKQLSVSRYNVVRYGCLNMAAFLKGRGLDLDAIGWQAWHTHLLCQVAEGGSAWTASSYLRASRLFVRWCVDMGLLDEPRNLSRLSVRTQQRAVQTLTRGVLETVLENSSRRTRLYILLGLNCGMTQVDIARLTAAQVDLPAGTITRKRSKTGTHAGVPTVRYRLWGLTRELLDEFGDRRAETLLRNKHGRALVWDELDPVKGFRRPHDNIDTCWRRASLGVTTLTFKFLRKTGASMLASHGEYAFYAAYYLGHAPATTADRHYVRPSDVKFDEAILWLGQQFGID